VAYVTAAALAGAAPVDRGAWALTSALPAGLVVGLAATRRRFPLSDASYVLIAAFLGMHTVGSHYTYSNVPLGLWLNEGLGIGRNPFDRIVHFAFGLLLTFPMMELSARLVGGRRLLHAYLAVATSLGLSGLWEILEASVAHLVSPELGAAYLGAQGDAWDAQKDMAAALGGALLCVVLTFALRRWPDRPSPALTRSREPAPQG
jgi:putative membrane protein